MLLITQFVEKSGHETEWIGTLRNCFAKCDVGTLPYLLGWLESDLSVADFVKPPSHVPSHVIRTRCYTRGWQPEWEDSDITVKERYPNCCIGRLSFFRFLRAYLGVNIWNVNELSVFEAPWQSKEQLACHTFGFYAAWEKEQFSDIVCSAILKRTIRIT